MSNTYILKTKFGSYPVKGLCLGEGYTENILLVCTVLNKKKMLRTLVKDGKVDFIQGVLQWSFVPGEWMELSSEYNKDKWTFIAKEQGGDWVMGN